MTTTMMQLANHSRRQEPCFCQRAIGELATNNQVCSATTTDTDKDGSSYLAEYLAGTDPKSQLSRFSVREIRRPGGAVTRVQVAP